MNNYKLGIFDERAYNHGRMVVEEMRETTGMKEGVAHFVCVAVFVNGYVQFAGADACISSVAPNRLTTKERAAIILERMNPQGEIDRRSAADVTPDAASIERLVRDAIIDYQEMYPHAPNDEAEHDLIDRAQRGNDWLVAHGYEPEPLIWDKEEAPCL